MDAVTSKILAKHRKAHYATDAAKWEALAHNDPNADGVFFYSVKTTHVYCLPSCPSRLPLRENVIFHSSAEAAERAGFRACKRCQPKGSSLQTYHGDTVAKACRVIETADTTLKLNELARTVGMSPFHFHRIFTKITGLTPKVYTDLHRAEKVRKKLKKSSSVTEAIYDAGYNSSGCFYTKSSNMLGMDPQNFRNQGFGVTIRFAVGECSLGSILVACSDKGVCAILLGDNPDKLIKDLQNHFSKAKLIGGDPKFERVVAEVVGLVENPARNINLPLDVKGTVFQKKVWRALEKIPVGKTASYTEIAERIGKPEAVRAVAGACGSNILAVAIPCHRVILKNGKIAGYRWGIERKQKLLQREKLAS